MNFGDDLNEWLWSKLLPDFFNGSEDTLFLGIGSVLGSQKAISHPGKKIVFGTGYVNTYHTIKPKLDDGSWDVYFVRGPRTAATLNLPKEKGLGDAAILIRNVFTLDNVSSDATEIGFMPHFLSLDRGNWKDICMSTGITLVDPRNSVDDVLKSLSTCKLLITEAMHGAIVADALRIPWIAVLPFDNSNRDKWYDWAESLDIPLRRHTLRPSSVEEYRRTIRTKELLHFFVYLISKTPLVKLIDYFLIKSAAASLQKIADYKTSLSEEKTIKLVQHKMNEHLSALKHKYSR